MDRIAIGHDSEILIGHGLPDPLLPPRAGREKSLVLTQPGAGKIAHRVSEVIGAPIYELPDREAAKTWETVGKHKWRIRSINYVDGRTFATDGVAELATQSYSGTIYEWN